MSLLESVLETFNFDVSEAVNWFDDIPPENIQGSRSSAADISTQGCNLNFDAHLNENEAIHSENTFETAEYIPQVYRGRFSRKHRFHRVFSALCCHNNSPDRGIIKIHLHQHLYLMLTSK